MSQTLLQVENLTVRFPLPGRALLPGRTRFLTAVRGVSLDVRQGETLGLVGESGCGKSTLARAILRFVQSEGEILFADAPLPRKGPSLRALRPDIQMIFQDPHASLNPRMTIHDALAEAVLVRRQITGGELRARVVELMEQVGLSIRHMHRYPHEFSGGQRQRVAIARALATEPKLIIADEPVSALDVSVQAQIINLLRQLSRSLDLTLIFISHDLAVVKHIADRVAVMYLGHIVEIGAAPTVIGAPSHPYTQALVSAIPEPDPDRQRERMVLAGEPPSPIRPPPGCPFHPRCPQALPKCCETLPELTPRAGDAPHSVRCIL